MKIIKELNLNKNPQYAKEGSLVFAKNIKVSNDSNCIVTEEGLSNILVGVNEIDSNIVDVVATDKELIIFTQTNKIYRYSETTKTTTLCNVPWIYSGGTIVGTYCYNINNELILAVAESEAGVDVPLKIFNLDKEIKSELETNICPQCPICQITNIEKVRGNTMPQGIYQLFIRFEITTDYYTKWQPIGMPLYALHNVYDTIVYHTRTIGSDTKTIKLNSTVNTEEDCLYNYKINLSLSNYNAYSKFQIGYILQNNNDTLCRIWKTFNINEGINTIIFDAKNHTEGNIDEFTDIPFNVYNVKNVLNFDNKLHIANFKETEYNIVPDAEISTFVDNIDVIPRAYDLPDTILNNVVYESFSFVYNLSSYKKETLSFERSLSTKLLYSIDDAEMYPLKKTILDREKGTGSLYLSSTGEVLLSVLYIQVNKSNDVQLAVYDSKTKKYTYSTTLNLYYNDTGVDVVCKLSVSKPKYSTFTKDINNTGFDNTIRTLQGDEVYSFYVHLVREDGTYTNGYKLTNKAPSTDGDVDLTQLVGNSTSFYNKYSSLQNTYLFELLNNAVIDKYFGYYENNDGDVFFKAPSNYFSDTKEIKQIGVEFKANYSIPIGYIGYFFSYEKVEPLVKYIAKAIANNASGNVVKNLFKASDAELSLSNIFGSMYKPLYIIDDNTITNIDQYWKYLSFAQVINTGKVKQLNNATLNNIGYNRVIYIDLHEATESSSDVIQYNATKGEVGEIITLNRNIYTSKIKTLIRLTDTITTNTDINPTLYSYPSFIVKDKAVWFDRNVMLSDTSSQVYELSYDTLEYDTADKKECSVQYYVNVDEYLKVSNYNLNALSYKIAPQHKVFVVNNKTVSYVNIVVSPENEKDLFELKGTFIEKPVITYNNFDTDRENQSEKTSIIRRSNVINDETIKNNWLYFDATQYKIINKNKGNITNLVSIKNNFLIHTDKTLLLLDNSQRLKSSTTTTDIDLSTQDIFNKEATDILDSSVGYGGLQHEKAFCVTDKGYFYFDNDNSAIFRLSDKIEELSLPIKRFLKNNNIIDSTFAYDSKNNRIIINLKLLNNNKYDFATLSFNVNLGTFVSIHDYDFDKSVHTKLNCYYYLYNPRREEDEQQPSETTTILTYDSNLVCNYGSLRAESNCFPKLSEILKTPDTGFCIDIIINDNYEQVKLINSLNYVLTKIISYYDTTSDCSAEDMLSVDKSNFDDKYNVTKLRLYSDSCDTDYIDTAVTDINKYNNYEKPHYNKGVWSFNYFRNKIIELYQKISNLAYDKKQKACDNISLIYGKYIVVRFVCKTEGTHIKFENFNANIDKY